jgi:hypothetical protein
LEKKNPQAMKDHLPLRTLPSSLGRKAPTVRVRTAEDAFARQRAEVVDAASVYYCELPLELRLLALGLPPSGVVTAEREGDQPDCADQVAA